MAKKKAHIKVEQRPVEQKRENDFFMQYYQNYLFADDISYCGGECDNTQCQRHRSHMPMLTPVSVSDFAEVCVSRKGGEQKHDSRA